MSKKEIVVEYFAVLSQEAKTASEIVLTDAETVEELFHELKRSHSFSLSQKQVKAAINNKVASNWQCSISSGDRILFIPPLVGG